MLNVYFLFLVTGKNIDVVTCTVPSVSSNELIIATFSLSM